MTQCSTVTLSGEELATQVQIAEEAADAPLAGALLELELAQRAEAEARALFEQSNAAARTLRDAVTELLLAAGWRDLGWAVRYRSCDEPLRMEGTETVEGAAAVIRAAAAVHRETADKLGVGTAPARLVRRLERAARSLAYHTAQMKKGA